MLKMLERHIASLEQRLVLLAPPLARVPDAFCNVAFDTTRHARMLAAMQAVRGSIYCQGGYVSEQALAPGGRHETPEDEKSWHLLITDGGGAVTSCLWYLEHGNAVSVDDLRVRHCPLGEVDEWRATLRAAVESEVQRARQAGLRFAEAGGWAVSQARRCSSDGLLLALAAYGLCRALGDALGITTANVTHASSSILRRLGFSWLEHGETVVPAYFDPKYNTMIELLRFDSRRPNGKYAALVERIRQQLGSVSVIASGPPAVVRPAAVIAGASPAMMQTAVAFHEPPMAQAAA